MVNMNNISILIMTGVESAAQMSIGQALLKIVDRIMWIVEKSVQWSIPTPEITAEENGKSFGKVELIRPLPWIIFLPSLLLLRIVRFGIDATASILGYPKVEPSDMIRVIQRGRRRLRAIKSSGLKNSRQKKMPTTKTIPVTEEKVTNLTTLPSPSQADKRKYSEISSGEISEEESDYEPLIAKIDRLANDSGSDKDYSPDEDSSDVSSGSEADVSITLSEVQDMVKEKEEMEKVWCAVPDCTNTHCDNELHTLRKEIPVASADCNEPQQTPVCENVPEELPAVCDKYCILTANGKGNDAETVYYSPISWKSVSPELSITPEKQDNNIDVQWKEDELNNGEVKAHKELINDSNKTNIEAPGELSNGQMKKQKTTAYSGSNNKHHYKHKRGNHGNRKKKHN